MEKDIFPLIGKRPIAEIEAPDLLRVLTRLEQRGVMETAHRARSECGQVFRYAIATGRCKRDISADLPGALQPVARSHFARMTCDSELPVVLFEALKAKILACALPARVTRTE